MESSRDVAAAVPDAVDAVVVIVLYIVGASIYQAFLWFRKWQEKKRDEKFSMDNEENKE